MKTWSYKSITQKTEKEIRRLMESSRNAETERLRELCEDWAYGVFLGWRSLVLGWMNDGDEERLESLAVRVSPAVKTVAKPITTISSGSGAVKPWPRRGQRF